VSDGRDNFRRAMDSRREEAVELLTGIHCSKKTYYPALRQKIEELETSNRLLETARLEAEQLSQELQRSVVRVSTVLAATQHISRTLELDQVIQESLDILTTQMGYPWAAIHVFAQPPSSETLHFEAARQANALGIDRELTVDQLLARPAFAEALRLQDLVVDRDWAVAPLDPLLVFLPLKTGERVLAMLALAAHEIAPRDLDVCRGLGRSLALAIDNASLYRRTAMQARRLDRALFSLGAISQALTHTTSGLESFVDQLVRTVKELTAASDVLVLVEGETESSGASGFCRLSPEQQRIMHSAMGSGGEPLWLEARALEHLWPVLQAKSKEAARSGPEGPRPLRSALCIPMLRGDRLIGTIMALTREAWDLELSETEILRILGSQTAVSMENARLYEEGERLRRHAEEHYLQAVRQQQVTEAKHQELERALHKISAVEQDRIIQAERARIARELHDSVAQVLYSIGLNLDWCRAKTEEGTELHERIGFLRELARGGVQEIRQSIFELTPAEVAEAGLPAALRRLAREYLNLNQVEVDCRVAEDVPPLGSERENELYRIVQEALFNVYKHAKARHVSVELGQVDGHLIVAVADDGIGVDAGVSPSPETKGYGLSGMRERARGLGGSFTCASAPGQGTRIEVRVPVS